MQGILCLLFIITITSNGSHNFPHDNLEKSRELSDFQNDAKEDIIRDEMEKKLQKPLNKIQNNVNFLEKRYIIRKKHHKHKKQTKMKNRKGKRRQRIQNKRKRSPRNLRKKKSIYSQRACEAECQDRSFNSEPCYCRNEKPIDFENQLKILNKGGEEMETNNEKSGILNGIQNFLKSNVTTLNPYQCSSPTTKDNSINIGITRENNFETTSEATVGTRIHIFKTTGEAITKVSKNFPETTSESFTEATHKNVIEFTSETVEPTQKNAVEVTNEFIMETTGNNVFETTSESIIEANNEVNKQVNCKLFPNEVFTETDEIFTEATSDPIIVTNNLQSSESTRKIENKIHKPELKNIDRIFDCENDRKIFDINEVENSFRTLTPTEEDIVDNTLSNNFDSNPYITTPFSHNSHNSQKLCNTINNNEESNDFSSNNRKYKNPIATFSLIFKTNKMAKPKSFRFKVKY